MGITGRLASDREEFDSLILHQVILEMIMMNMEESLEALDDYVNVKLTLDKDERPVVKINAEINVELASKFEHHSYTFERAFLETIRRKTEQVIEEAEQKMKS